MIDERIASRRARTKSRRGPRRWQLEPLEDRRLLSTILAVTEQAQLLRFDSEAPSVVLGSMPIVGLQSGESVLGIDARPATGELYALGSANRLYTINPLSGVATLKAALTADPADSTSPFTALDGTDFGIDFNPVVDRLRVVSNAGQNLRINPDSGLVTTDTPLAYAPGTPHGGPVPPAEAPFIVDAAYANNVPGAATTTLFGLDSAGNDPTGVRHILVRQDPPNAGTLTKVAPFGKEGAIPVGFDIAPDGTAYVAVDARGAVDRRFLLVTIDLTTGADASHGTIGDGSVAIRDIAVVPGVQFGAPRYAVQEDAGAVTITVTRTDGTTPGVATVDFATANGSAQAGSDFAPTAGTIVFLPGESTKTITIPIVNDADAEGDEFFTVTLSNPTGGVVLGGPNVATVRIDTNDRRDRRGPVITSVLETGPSRNISGFRATFNEDLDPTRAQDVRNYALFGIGARGRRTRIGLASASYDPVDRAVKVTASQPFMQTRFRQLEFRFNGRRPRGLTDLHRNFLRGNTVFRFALFSGTTVTFTDRDRDRATVTIANGGSLDGIRPLRATATQKTQFWILDPIALRSTLSGTVRRSPSGDGIVVIAEIIGLDKKEFTPLISNPSFRVNTLTFSSNATGIG